MLVKKENIPRVKMFKGSAKIFRIGRKTIKRKVKASPPKIYVIKPPDTLTPGRTWAKKNIENELKSTVLKNDFTI